MDNKLSELSKPVAWRYRYTKPGITDSHGEAWVGDWKFVTDEVNCNPAPNYQKCALYSQEYVSALKRESAVNWEAAASLNVENQELKNRITELEQAMCHIHGAALDITVPRVAIAKAAGLAVEHAAMKEQSNG